MGRAVALDHFELGARNLVGDLAALVHWRDQILLADDAEGECLASSPSGLLAFLRKIEAEVSAELDIHIICDNYATHKHPKALPGLSAIPAFICDLSPT